MGRLFWIIHVGPMESQGERSEKKESGGAGSERDLKMLALKMEEEATGQGIQGASKSWKRQRN